MDQVLTNVLENALKYAPPAVLVRMVAAARAGGIQVRLTVEDGGPGVPTRRCRASSTSSIACPGRRGLTRGTGIGLAVVRGLTEAMGGRSTLGAASSVAWPSTSTCPGTASPGRPARRHRGRSRSPDADGASTVRGPRGRTRPQRRHPRGRGRFDMRREVSPQPGGARLPRDGGRDGRRGADRVGGQRPDVVLLDLGLPDLDGITVVRRVRREATTPILILSARVRERSRSPPWRAAPTTT